MFVMHYFLNCQIINIKTQLLLAWQPVLSVNIKLYIIEESVKTKRLSVLELNMETGGDQIKVKGNIPPKYLSKDLLSLIVKK